MRTVDYKLIVVYETFKDEEGTIEELDVLAYLDLEDDETIIIFETQYGIPCGDYYETTKSDLDRAIKDKIKEISYHYGEPIN